MTNVAVILAGGMGTRVGGNTPKQFLPLADGRSVLEHSIDAFEAATCIDEIAIVMHPEWLEEAQIICRRNTWTKVRKIIPGGSERWESSWHAIEAYYKDKGLTANDQLSLWLHDAARPFVSQRILAEIAQALKEHAAVTVAVPVTDTLYKVQMDETQATKTVETIPSRSDFMRAQTPQAFHLNVIKEAFERALAKGEVAVTDDVGIVHTYMSEQPIFIVSGEEANRKITYAEDLK